MNQSQTYQGNPYGVYRDLSSLTGSDVIQKSITYIKQSAPSKDHIKTNHLILLMEKMRGMKRMREEGGMRGIGREEIIEDMEVDKERKGLRE